MGYQPDIKQSGDEELLVTFNRHADNYSSSDLSQEVILMTSRIAWLIKNIDRSDAFTVNLGWEKIEQAIKTKAYLVSIQAKLTNAIASLAEQERLNNVRIEDIRFKQQQATKKILPLDEFKEAVSKVTEVVLKHVESEKMPDVIAEIEALVKRTELNAK